MPLAQELPRLLREAGIATEEQAERLADGIARVLDAENPDPHLDAESVRRVIRT